VARLIEPRFMELEAQKGFADELAFEAYLNASAAGMHVLLAQDESELVQRAGAFYAFVGGLRRLPYALARAYVPLPLTVLRQHGISPAAIEAGIEKEAFAQLMRYFIKQLDEKAHALHDDIKKAPRLIRRLHVAALLYVRALKKVNGNPALLPKCLPNLPLRLWLVR
jgi:phytoene/squalene synthetase